MMAANDLGSWSHLDWQALGHALSGDLLPWCPLATSPPAPEWDPGAQHETANWSSSDRLMSALPHSGTGGEGAPKGQLCELLIAQKVRTFDRTTTQPFLNFS